MPTYFPKKIEPKWQRYWLENKTFRAVRDDRPKYYILDMFPYPSGDGLHVGHPEGYTATDILARYKRMRGMNVLHPMGWDAFGLPAEQYAVKTGTHPRETTNKNIANFRRQIQMLGFSYDWDREVNTTDPDYYKWTQWIFLQLYNTWYDKNAGRGRPISELEIPEEIRVQGEDTIRQYQDEHRLAYLAEVPVNWCPELGTVLANEEVINGRSEVGNHPVIRMPMRQWMLRITSYAERLLQDLDTLDWSEPIKKMQREWIGRSEGAEVDFFIVDKKASADVLEQWYDAREKAGFPRRPDDQSIRIYTTRPDTLFGATYLVLAPEHPLVDRITTEDQREKVREYRERAARKSDLDRTDLAKEKTGVFTGCYAMNPVNEQLIPIWIADYVLMGYGTGAIMAVPAHDTRDFEFATQYGLDIAEVVIDPEDNPKILLHIHRWLGEWERTRLAKQSDKYLKVALILNAGFDLESFQSDLKENEKDPLWAEVNWYYDPDEGKGIAVSFLEDDFADLLVEYLEQEPDTQILLLSLDPDLADEEDEEDEDEEAHEDAGEVEATDVQGEASGHGHCSDEHCSHEGGCCEGQELSQAYTGEGICVDSGIITGLPTAEAKAMITDWLEQNGLGRKSVNYKLRDWLFSRQRYWGEPFPILLDDKGGHRSVGFDELPVTLPDLADFKPTGTPEPPLSKAPADWLNVERDGRTYRRETNTMPQWAGSCWYYLRYLDPKNSEAGWSKEEEQYWMPVDLYVGGAEHAVLHLLYSRFWHKLLYDLGYVHTIEPFQKLVNQGMILGEMEFVGYKAGEEWVSVDGVSDNAEGIKVRTSDNTPVTAVRLEADQVQKVGSNWTLAENQAIAVDARAFKMSKSRGNVINPDSVVEDYGADALRMYEMFMGPLEATKPWSMSGVEGIWRFLNRVWRLVIHEEAEQLALSPAVTDEPPSREQLRMLHVTIRGVTEDIEAMRFNTAISKLMELTNYLSKASSRPKSILEPFVLMLSPFAPHMGEELWQALGHEKTLAYEPWPTYDPELCKADEIEVAVQINNKVKAKLTVAADDTDDQIIEQARSDEKVVPLLEGKTIVKSMVVSSRKGKLINFIVK